MKMHTRTAGLATACAFLVLTGCLDGGDDKTEDGRNYMIGKDETIIMRIDGQDIPEARLVAYATPGVEINDQMRQQLIDNIVINQLLSAKAGSELGTDPHIREQIEIARQGILSRALLSRMIKENPVSDEQVQQNYDRIVAENAGAKEYNSRHILVQEEAEAREILAELQADPSKFADIAGERSIDTGSGQNGGELGWTSPENFVPEFSNAMIAIEKGTIGAEPVQSQFGWHIISVTDVRDAPVPELNAELRQQIASTLQNEIVSRLIGDIRREANVEDLKGNG